MGDFDGPVLAAGIARALLAIPGAIKVLRELLRSERPDTTAAARVADSLAEHLGRFREIGRWLEEAKLLHELLQNLENSLDEIQKEWGRATADGRFAAHRYRVEVVRPAWERSQHPFEQLLSFAETITHVDTKALVRDVNGLPTSGPEWAQLLATRRLAIVEIFKRWDEATTTELVNKLGHEMRSVDDLVKRLAGKADARIRNEAHALGRALEVLAATVLNAEQHHVA